MTPQHRPLHEQVVVVTGATAGVGRATVRALVAQGAKVGLLARGREGLSHTLDEVEAAGGQGFAASVDVADEGSVLEAADAVAAALGPIDIWINNAMVTMLSRFVDMTPEEYRRITDVTYLGSVWGTLAALRHMIPRRRGTIVQVGSALAHRGIPLQSGYCGAKHALDGFLESLRTELDHDGIPIDVSMVQLPALNTPQFRWTRNRMPKEAMPVPPIFQPEVAAESILYACLHPRREILVGAPTVKAVWGNRIAPQVVRWYLARTGFEAQQTDEPLDRRRPDNLFEPVPGDRGAHGVFDAVAKPRSVQLWLTTHRSWAAAVVAVAVAVLLVLGSLGCDEGGLAETQLAQVTAQADDDAPGEDGTGEGEEAGDDEGGEEEALERSPILREIPLRPEHVRPVPLRSEHIRPIPPGSEHVKPVPPSSPHVSQPREGLGGLMGDDADLVEPVLPDDDDITRPVPPKEPLPPRE